MKQYEPTQGQVRCVKRFAIFPKKIGREHRWLETYYMKQVYKVYVMLKNTWGDERFIDKEEYLNWRKEQKNGRSKDI